MNKSDAKEWLRSVEGKSVCVYDTETTGLDPESCDIISFSAVKYLVENGNFVQKDVLDMYISVDYTIPEHITKINGITNDILNNYGLTRDHAMSRIRKFFGDHPNIVGYNTPFDRVFTEKLYESVGDNFLPGSEMDVLELARLMLPGSHKLEKVATTLGVEKNLIFHNSLCDCKATMGVLYRLLSTI